MTSIIKGRKRKYIGYTKEAKAFLIKSVKEDLVMQKTKPTKVSVRGTTASIHLKLPSFFDIKKEPMSARGFLLISGLRLKRIYGLEKVKFNAVDKKGKLIKVNI